MAESDVTPTPPPSTIGPDEVRKLIADGADFVLVDVRNPKIFDKQGWTTFPSARVIPLNELKDHLPELPKDRLIVTTCMKGFISVTAREFLKEHGYPRVEMARFDEYLAKGYPVVEVPKPL
jgi:rhodanese-related sulfurtransferase